MALSEEWIPRKIRPIVGVLLSSCILLGAGMKIPSWVEAQAEEVTKRETQLMEERITKQLLRIENKIDMLAGCSED